MRCINLVRGIQLKVYDRVSGFDRAIVVIRKLSKYLQIFLVSRVLIEWIGNRVTSPVKLPSQRAAPRGNYNYSVSFLQPRGGSDS